MESLSQGPPDHLNESGRKDGAADESETIQIMNFPTYVALLDVLAGLKKLQIPSARG
jgi:hypothetical protein